ncbi:MAG TPA: nuclear transport factor 2 family protein [Candidatus Sulfotelmatobacter sp.]|nr:nuclear transport factor 2 family protein [Candidatus Sulfotelmatobacter sp.]
MASRAATNDFMALIIASLVLVLSPAAAARATVPQPSAKSALSAEESINQALLNSDADALETLLADGWIVVSGFGGIGERKDFIAYVRAGDFTRSKMILSDPRVRLYGNTALVTTHLNAAGRSIKERNGQIVSDCFDVKERQTDVLVWKNGSWKSVLLHETVIPGTLRRTVIPGRTARCTVAPGGSLQRSG